MEKNLRVIFVLLVWNARTHTNTLIRSLMRLAPWQEKKRRAKKATTTNKQTQNATHTASSIGEVEEKRKENIL